MTTAEYFNQLQGYKEDVHIQAFKMIIAELQENNPDVNLDWCLPKFKGAIKWLNSPHKSIG